MALSFGWGPKCWFPSICHCLSVASLESPHPMPCAFCYFKCAAPCSLRGLFCSERACWWQRVYHCNTSYHGTKPYISPTGKHAFFWSFEGLFKIQLCMHQVFVTLRCQMSLWWLQKRLEDEPWLFSTDWCSAPRDRGCCAQDCVGSERAQHRGCRRTSP